MNRPNRVLDHRKPTAEPMERRDMAGSVLDALILGALAGTTVAPVVEPTGHTAVSAASAMPEPAPANGQTVPVAIPDRPAVAVGESAAVAESKYSEPPPRVSGPISDLDQARAELWASSIGPWIYRDDVIGKGATSFAGADEPEGFVHPISSASNQASPTTPTFASMASAAALPFAIISADRLEKGQPPVATSNSYSTGITDLRLSSADLIDVTLSGDDLITIEADPGTPAYAGPPQWLDNNGDGTIDPDAGDRSLPVGYPRGSHVTAEATFKGEWTLSTGPFPEDKTKYYASGLSNSTGLAFPAQQLTVVGDRLFYPATESNGTLFNAVWYGDLDITWTVFNNNQSTLMIPAGTSYNELYVTLASPSATPVYHTMIDIGVSSALMAADEPTAIDGVWNRFKTLSVNTRHIDPSYDGKTLYYYKEWDTMAGNVGPLLTTHDGQCGGWAELFLMTLQRLGVKQTPKSGIQRAPIAAGESFLVNTWTFTEPGTSGNATYPYQNSLADPSKNPADFPGGIGSYIRKDASGAWGYYWGSTAEVNDWWGVAGQSTWNPKASFGDHWITKVGDFYYDPSYGRKFTTLEDWEAGSLAGFYKVDTLQGGTYRLIFRKNPPGLDTKTVATVPYG